MFNVILDVPDNLPPWMPGAVLYIFIVFHRSIGGFGIALFRSELFQRPPARLSIKSPK